MNEEGYHGREIDNGILKIKVKDQFGITKDKYFKTMQFVSKDDKKGKRKDVELQEIPENFKTEISIDNFEDIQARDIQDLLKNKQNKIDKIKGDEVRKLLNLLRRQAFTCVVIINMLIMGLYFDMFVLAFILTTAAVLLVKVVDGFINIRRGKKKNNRRIRFFGFFKILRFLSIPLCYTYYAYLNLFSIKLTFCMTPYILLTIFYLLAKIYYLFEKNDLSQSLWDIPLTVLTNLQILFIFMKIDNLTAWRWKEVFWLFWIISALFLAMLLGLLLVLFVKIFVFIFSCEGLYQMKYYVTMSLLSINILLICSLVLTLEEGDFTNIEKISDRRDFTKDFLNVVVVLDFLTAIFLLCTKFWKADLTKFLVEELDIEIDFDDDGETIDFAINSFRKGVFRVPLYLIKESSTFYKKKNRNHKPKMKKELFSKKQKNKGMASKKITVEDVKKLHNLEEQELNYVARPNQKLDTEKSDDSIFQNQLDPKNMNFLIGSNSSRVPLDTYFGENYIKGSQTDRKRGGNNSKKNMSTSFYIPKKFKEEKFDPKGDKQVFLQFKTTNRILKNYDAEEDEGKICNFVVGQYEQIDDINPPDMTRRSGGSEGFGKIEPEGEILEEQEVVEGDVDEIRSFGEGGICVICFTNEPDGVFLPCGHGGFCSDCGIDVWAKQNECYLCRGEVTQLLKIDLTCDSTKGIRVVSSTRAVG